VCVVWVPESARAKSELCPFHSSDNAAVNLQAEAKAKAEADARAAAQVAREQVLLLSVLLLARVPSTDSGCW
jgi:hypothetical protein